MRIAKGSFNAHTATSAGFRTAIVGTQPSPSDEWEDFSTLQSLMDDASGGKLNLTGRKFRPTLAEISASASNISGYIYANTAITGGIISGECALTFTPHATEAGVFEADLPHANYDDPRIFIFDENAASRPKLQNIPRPPAAMDQYRMVHNPNWTLVANAELTQTGNGPITGFDIASASDISDIDDLLTDSGNRSAVGVTLIMVVYPNVIATGIVQSWDNSTGILVFEDPVGDSSAGTEDVYFCVTGDVTRLEAGEFGIDNANQKIYYKPANGDASAVSVPAIPYVLQVETGVSMNSTIVRGCSTNGKVDIGGNQPANMTLAGNSVAGVYLTLTDCEVTDGFQGVNGFYLTATRCTFARACRRLANIGAGSQISKCFFYWSEGASPIFMDGGTARSTTNPVPYSLIEHCYFEMPVSQHGQAIAAYDYSAQNMEIRHNIFYNCKNALTFKKGSFTTNTDAHELVFENNLVFTDSVLLEIDAGSASRTIRCEVIDSHLDGHGQEVTFRHNTVMATEDVLSLEASRQFVSMELANVRYSSMLCEANHVGLLDSAPRGTDYPWQSGTTHSHHQNGITWQLPGSDYSQTNSYSKKDLVYRTPSDTFNTSTLQATNEYATGANDGGKIGFRWQANGSGNQITAADLPIDSIPSDWYDQWPEETLPAAADRTDAESLVARFEDWREYATKIGSYSFAVSVTEGTVSGSGKASTQAGGHIQVKNNDSNPTNWVSGAYYFVSPFVASSGYSPEYPDFALNDGRATDWVAAFRGNYHALEITRTGRAGGSDEGNTRRVFISYKNTGASLATSDSSSNAFVYITRGVVEDYWFRGYDPDGDGEPWEDGDIMTVNLYEA